MISFVVLHYQAIDETISCLDTIFLFINECKVILVDNCSPNGTGELLKEKYCNNVNIKVLLLSKNLGFAKGNNIGYREAKKDNPDFIIVMNNDVFIQQDNFAELLEKAYNKYKYDVLGPDIYSTQKKYHQNPQREKNFSLEELKKTKKILKFKNKFSIFLRLKYLIKKIYKVNNYNELRHEEAIEGVVLHGACYIFSKQFIKTYNSCFYDNTFMYYESYILHYLGMREQLKFIYEPSIRVLHHEDVATNYSYKSQYNKSIFVNKCLLESCTEFIRIIQNDNVRLG